MASDRDTQDSENVIYTSPTTITEEEMSMTRTFNWPRLLHTTVPGILLILSMAITFTVAPSAHAANQSSAAVTTASVSYRFDAQIVQGVKAGTPVHGWLSGSLDSTGVLTATLTATGLTPLRPGCAAHQDFGPACGLPASANVNGKTTGRGSSAIATFVAIGKGWTWILAGGAAGAIGQWTGTLTQGSAYVGTWSLTPQTATVHIDMGGRSDGKSKDNIVLSSSINLNVTADGWAIGTFSPIDGTHPTIVQGFVNMKSGSAEISIPMGKMGTLLVTGWSRPGFGNLRWTGSFVGPAIGDYGTWSGQG